MDPIKSVDTIYQSMFRVLTERKGKTKGYFVDLLSERFINFMYDYEKYTNKGKKNMDIKNKKKKLTEKLFSFNLNGINSNMIYDTKMRSIYTSLIQKLSLDSNESFGERLEDTQKTNLTKLLDDINPKEIVNDLFNKLKGLDMLFAGKEGKSGSNLKLHERTKPKDSEETEETEEPEQPEEPEEQNTESNHKETDKQKRDKYNQVIGYIKDLFSLYILFEKDLLDQEILPGCNEENIKQFIDFLKYEITFDDIKKICTESNNTRIIDCHISYMKSLNLKSTDTELLKKNTATLNMYRHLIIDFFESIPNTALDDFMGFYCTIRDKFMLIKDSLNRKETKYVPKCGIVNNRNEPTLKSNTLNGGGKELIDENILEIIRKYLVVKDTEKKLFGEVFTPVELVCEMLEKLPDEVWKNPTLKWLDPANGIGNYPIAVYYKLMESLKASRDINIDKIKREYKLDITKDTDRSKHIIKNMLFMVELNPVNVKVCKKIFKMIDSNAEPNIYNSPFYTDTESKLKENWTSKCKIKIPTLKFDIIMGNPPYNQGGIRSKSGTGGENTKTIWPLFIENSLNILNKNGYLIFITPSTWTSLNSGHNNISTKMLDLQIEYLKCYNYAASLEKFGGGGGKIPLSYYLLKNINTKNDTLIWDDNHTKFLKFNIYKTDFIPNFNVSIISKIFKKSIFNYNYKKSSGINIVELNDKYSYTHKFPVIHYASNKMLLKYSKKCGKINMIKLLLPNSSMGYPIIDILGIINCEKADSYNIIYDDIKILKKLQLFLLSSLGFLLINSLKTRQNFFSNRIFEILPDVSKLDFKITDENLNKYFEFDEMDIKAIEQQKTSGEGNLTDRQKQEIINFDIEKYISKDQIKFIKESIDKECPKMSKRTKKAPLNNGSNMTKKSKTKKNNFKVRSSEPTYMIKCPPKILNDPLIKTHQERKELCRRHYEDKPTLSSKPSPTELCNKITLETDCGIIKGCVYKDGVCTTKKSKYKYDGPHKDKFLKGSTKKFGSKKYNSLDNAIRNANTNNTVGGITKKKLKFTIRKGTDLKDSGTSEESWIKLSNR